jgi:hypothetical protein
MSVACTMAVVIALVAYFVALAVISTIAFFAVIFLAGPHGGALPPSAEVYVLSIGWIAVIILPAVIAWLVWKTYKRK